MDNFPEEIYDDRTFEGLSVQEGRFTGKTFTQCEFERCDFTKTAFIDCRFDNCRFCNCDLSLARPSECIFLRTEFESSKLVGINWTHAKKQLLNFHEFNFSKCVLNYSIFMGLNLKKIHMTDCLAKEVDFAEADLTQASFTGTDLAGSHFLHTNLTKADFVGAVNYAIDPTCNLVKKTQFSLPEAVALLKAFDIVLK
jgi:uncharacterized protein YjbI with pentapeptide repeats